MPHHLQLPQIGLLHRLGGHNLAAVNDGAAAHRQQNVNFVILAHLRAFADRINTGIRLNAGKFK